MSHIKAQVLRTVRQYHYCKSKICLCPIQARQKSNRQYVWKSKIVKRAERLQEENLRSTGFQKSDPFSLEGINKKSVLLLKTADSVSSYYADFSEANIVMKQQCEGERRVRPQGGGGRKSKAISGRNDAQGCNDGLGLLPMAELGRLLGVAIEKMYCSQAYINHKMLF